MNYRAAEGSPVLIALQRIPCCGKEVSRVKIAIAQELEKVAVIFIRARFNNRVDGRGGMIPVLCGQRAGFDFKLLQGVRKRERKIDAVKQVVVHRAIEIVPNAGKLAARY